MDVSAILLNKLLVERNLDVWGRLKLAYLDPEYTSLYAAISRYYTQYSNIPSFDELELVVRDLPVSRTLAALRLVDDAEVSLEVALDALIDQYTQNECVKLLDKFIDKLPVYDTSEIKDNLAALVLELDEKTLSSEGVFTMYDIPLFMTQEDISANRVPTGLNNDFDAATAGLASEELLLIGGKRGSGKSITCSNLVNNQLEMGFASCYFTIEMTAKETAVRNAAIGANISHDSLKKGTLTSDEIMRLVEYKAKMYSNGDEFVDGYIRSRDHFKFESDIIKHGKPREDAQIIIIDDRALTIGSIDLHLGKMKARFKDKFKLAVVDYLNQIVVEGASQFDWQPQVIVSKKLKELARKYEIGIVSPYQIDKDGEARFAKGILDAADIALLMTAHDKETGAIGFETTKIRGAKEINCTSGINWETLRISPIPKERPVKEDKIKRAKSDDHEPKEPKPDLPF